MANLSTLPVAAAEYAAALDTIAAANPRRGQRFQDAFHAAIQNIELMPQAWGFADDIYRFYKLKKFPYIIYYREGGDEVVIVAVGHERQNFGYWQGR